MGTYTLDFSFVFANLPLLMRGLAVTLELTLISVAVGLIAGFFVCLMAMSPFKPLAWIAISFIEIFRCTPALIQLIWIFYCVPIFLGVFIEPIPMAILALSMNVTAYNAEAYRAAIQSIPRAQLDACVALGLSPWERTIYVVLPQALFNATPVLLTNAIGLLQQSALVAIVAIGDLMYEGKTLATASYRPIEIFTVVAAIYFLVALPVSQTVALIERRFRRRAS
jgi:polar amino acid transport system permease protein